MRLRVRRGDETNKLLWEMREREERKQHALVWVQICRMFRRERERGRRREQ